MSSRWRFNFCNFLYKKKELAVICRGDGGSLCFFFSSKSLTANLRGKSDTSHTFTSFSNLHTPWPSCNAQMFLTGEEDKAVANPCTKLQHKLKLPGCTAPSPSLRESMCTQPQISRTFNALNYSPALHQLSMQLPCPSSQAQENLWILYSLLKHLHNNKKNPFSWGDSYFLFSFFLP